MYIFIHFYIIFLKIFFVQLTFSIISVNIHIIKYSNEKYSKYLNLEFEYIFIVISNKIIKKYEFISKQ